MGNVYDEMETMQWPEHELTRAQQDRILEQALGRIREDRQPEVTVRRTRRPVWRLAAAAAALCCLCAGGVAAAGHFLAPTQVAQQMEQRDLSALFAGPDAVQVEETQQAGDYTVTLLGLTSGANVTEYWSSDWKETDAPRGRSYAVLAVSRRDGTPMADLDAETPDVTVSNSLVSPVLGAPDCPLMDYNVYTMNGARRDLVEEGVHYILVETDLLEPFADKNPQLAVVLNSTDSISDLLNGYTQDPETGTIAPKAGMESRCLLFDLPIDESKADPEQAAALRDQWLGTGVAAEENADGQDLLDDLATITPEQVRAQGTLQSTETVSITDGVYGMGWYYGDGGFQAGAADWEPEEKDRVAMWSDAGQVVLMTYNPDDTLTVE
ncbi:hypothetical protein, partial [uncultured Subdoligranulum sp.]|uniref:hypothetical protein n=1 Tax=uncultured Subdoligranulum sp. TaxID=512298 RepID=UPI00261F7DAF